MRVRFVAQAIEDGYGVAPFHRRSIGYARSAPLRTLASNASMATVVASRDSEDSELAAQVTEDGSEHRMFPAPSGSVRDEHRV